MAECQDNFELKCRAPSEARTLVNKGKIHNSHICMEVCACICNALYPNMIMGVQH